MNKKILISGSINGNFDQIFEQVQKLQSKNQNFDFLILIGSTLSLTSNLDKYISNQKSVPILTYFLDSSELCPVINQIYPQGAQICKNLHFLGKSGIIQIQAFINGIENKFYDDFYEKDIDFSGNYYTQKDINQIYQQFQEYQHVDIFISLEWPQNFQNFVSFDRKIEFQSNKISQLSNNLCPRYHFVPNDDYFYQRQPYFNKKNILTRLISIAQLNQNKEQNKEKFLYAFQIQKFNLQEIQQQQQQDDGTDNPYEPKQQIIKETTIKQDIDDKTLLFFSGFDGFAREDEINEFLQRLGNNSMKYLEIFYIDKKKHKGCGLVKYKDYKFMQKAIQESGKYSFQGQRIFFKIHVQNERQQNCWFCYDDANFDKSLVFYKEDNFYLSLDKGPIFDKHFQIVPIQHFQSTASMPINLYNQIQQTKLHCQQNFFKNYQQSLIIYERVQRINQNFHHTNIQCIPIHNQQMKFFQDSFEAIVYQNKLNFFKLKENENIQSLLNESSQYFLMEFYIDNQINSYLFIQKDNDQSLALDFGRQIICSLFGVPNKQNWKNCIINQSQIKQQIAQLNQIF